MLVAYYQDETERSRNRKMADQFGGGKKISSAFLLELNFCSTSAGTLNDALSPSGDNAFHTEVLPARCVKIGLQTNQAKKITLRLKFKRMIIKNKYNMIRGGRLGATGCTVNPCLIREK